MLVAQSTLSHICKLNGTLGARVHEPVALLRMELSGRDHLCKLLHVGGLDVDDVEALVLDVEVPEVDPQVITADESLAIAVNGYAVDVICVSVCVRLPGYGGNDGVVVCQPRKLQIRGGPEMNIRVPNRATSSSNTTSRSQLM